LDSRLPTVSLRMNRQSKNAQRLAEALDGHKKLSSVIYPTLFRDPEQKRIFEKQCAYPGGIFSVDFKGGKAAAFDFLRNLQIARSAVSLGGLETLVFTAGIGAGAPSIRQRICEGLEFLGIRLDADRNRAGEPVISRDQSPVTVRVMKTDEELVIARHTCDLLRRE